MWIRNNGRCTWIAGGRELHARDYIESVDDWTAFLADPVISKRVAAGEIEVDVSPPGDLRKWQYYNVAPLAAHGENIGTCLLCHAPVDNLTRRWTGEGGSGNSWTLYIANDAEPAVVYYDDPETLVIERRT